MLDEQCQNLGNYLQVRRISYFSTLRLFQVFTLSSGALMSSELKQYLANFTGLLGRVNATIYKTE